MHYSAYSFTINGNPTIVPKPESGVELDQLGQRDGMSDLDVEEMNAVYG